MTLDATLGMFEIGILIAGVLFGLITAQVYIHHKTFPEESKWIKYGLVTTIWLLDMGHTICAFHVIYFYTVIHYGDYSSLESMPDSMPVLTVIQGITIITGCYSINQESSKIHGRLEMAIYGPPCFESWYRYHNFWDLGLLFGEKSKISNEKFLASSTTLTPKVFTNTMLANMNSRAILQNMHSSQATGRSTSGDQNYPGIALQLASPRSPRPVNIAVHTEVQIQEDAERQWPLPGSEPESVLEMDSETQKSGYMAY
ncbi:hypothetical protein EV360DRAFT_68529 [Lentinula raphanica]|nr:hypothetical protein EV360DRAFT_68529 [Lentinula raphanica]